MSEVKSPEPKGVLLGLGFPRAMFDKVLVCASSNSFMGLLLIDDFLKTFNLVRNFVAMIDKQRAKSLESLNVGTPPTESFSCMTACVIIVGDELLL